MKATILAFVLALLSACAATPLAKQQEEAPPREGAPFARVALALRGCSSCAQCRSTIRQTTKGAAESGAVKVGSDQVEVTFATPQTVPLESVIHKLSQNGLHDLAVLDVLFDAEGSVQKTESGFRFSLRETKQSFPLRVAETQEVPPLGEPLRLRTIVQGWNKGDEAIYLELKYVIESLDPSKRALAAAASNEER